MLGRPAGSTSGRTARREHGREREERERRLDEEDRLPAERLREDPAGGGPERGAEHAGRRPRPDGTRVGAVDRA